MQIGEEQGDLDAINAEIDRLRELIGLPKQPKMRKNTAKPTGKSKIDIHQYMKLYKSGMKATAIAKEMEIAMSTIYSFEANCRMKNIYEEMGVTRWR